MALLSSKTLIQAHALFLFVLAVYLTRSPEVVTESDLVFMLGEFLNLVCLYFNIFIRPIDTLPSGRFTKYLSRSINSGGDP